MSVQFGNQPQITNPAFTQKKTGMAGKLVDWGIASSTKTANTYLTILALLFFGLTAFVIFT